MTDDGVVKGRLFNGPLVCRGGRFEPEEILLRPVEVAEAGWNETLLMLERIADKDELSPEGKLVGKLIDGAGTDEIDVDWTETAPESDRDAAIPPPTPTPTGRAVVKTAVVGAWRGTAMIVEVATTGLREGICGTATGLAEASPAIAARERTIVQCMTEDVLRNRGGSLGGNNCLGSVAKGQ